MPTTNHNLAKTMFRLLLRWGRSSHILSSCFTIDLNLFKIDSKILHNLANHGILSISDEETGKRVLRSCFRCEGDIFLAMEALKTLNDIRAAVVHNYERRKRNILLSRTYSFRIGQIVIHKETRRRGVVASWTWDKSDDKKQLVQCHFDLFDANEFGHGDSNSHLIPSEELQLVDDKALTRISSPKLAADFIGYNVAINRYVPHQNLAFLFPNDFAGDENDGQPEILGKVLENACSGIHMRIQELQRRLKKVLWDRCHKTLTIKNH